MATKYKKLYCSCYGLRKNVNLRILFVLITFLLVVFVRQVKGETPLDFETVRLAIIEGTRQNEGKLSCGVLHWTRQTIEDGFMVPGRRTERQGNYSLFWDGKKVATQYEHDLVTSIGKGSSVDYEIKRGGERKAFDGKEFRQVFNVENPKDIAISYEVRFKLHENWFEIVGWYGRVDYYPMLSKPDEFDHVTFEAFSVDMKESTLIKVVGTVKETQERMIWYFDPDKSNCLVRKEFFYPNGHLHHVCRYQLKQVAGGAWFPIEKESKTMDADTQKVKLHHHYKLNVEKSSYNDPSKIPEGIFHIPITPDMEISDYRGGVRINYEQNVTPLVMDVLEEMVDDFIDETEDTPGTTVTSPANETDQNNAVVQIRPPVSDPPEVLLQYATFRKIKRIVCWVAIVAGIVFMSFAVYGWRRKKVLSLRNHSTR